MTQICCGKGLEGLDVMMQDYLRPMTFTGTAFHEHLCLQQMAVHMQF